MAPGVGAHGGHGGLELLEAFLSPGKPAIAFRENLFARMALEHGEEADADPEFIFGGRLFFGETRQLLEQGEFPPGGEGVEIALLSAIPVGGAFCNPGLFDKTAEEGIDEVVVHAPVAGHEAGEFFEGVTVPGAFHQGSEKD